MIISASRRTDIPAFYSEWFMNRVRAGWCQVPNPMKPSQVSRVSLRQEDVDAIVFWSKNPAPLLPHLGELDGRGYRYYFQFTLNDYPAALEPRLPSLRERLETFRRLADRLGPRRVVWRYDPIIVSSLTPPDFHVEKFGKLAEALKGFTCRVMVSFVDYYRKTTRNLKPMENDGWRFDCAADTAGWARDFIGRLVEIGREHGIVVWTCSEERDFSDVGAPPGRCIDGILLHELWGLSGHIRKDPSQREACLCVVSKDIGVNDTCLHGCPYCYATQNRDLALRRRAEHDPGCSVMWGQSRAVSEGEKAEQSRVRLL